MDTNGDSKPFDNYPETPMSAESNSDLIGHMSDKKCPRCGCALLINRRGDEWCSLVGGVSSAGCTFGMEDVGDTEK